MTQLSLETRHPQLFYFVFKNELLLVLGSLDISRACSSVNYWIF